MEQKSLKDSCIIKVHHSLSDVSQNLGTWSTVPGLQAAQCVRVSLPHDSVGSNHFQEVPLVSDSPRQLGWFWGLLCILAFWEWVSAVLLLTQQGRGLVNPVSFRDFLKKGFPCRKERLNLRVHCYTTSLNFHISTATHKDTQAHTHTLGDIYTPRCIETLFTRAEICNQSKGLLTDEQIKKMWYVYKMKYYSHIKWTRSLQQPGQK